MASVAGRSARCGGRAGDDGRTRQGELSTALRHILASMVVSTTGNNAAITTQLGQQGLGQQPWWVEQWMELINAYR